MLSLEAFLPQRTQRRTENTKRYRGQKAFVFLPNCSVRWRCSLCPSVVKQLLFSRYQNRHLLSLPLIRCFWFGHIHIGSNHQTRLTLRRFGYDLTMSLRPLIAAIFTKNAMFREISRSFAVHMSRQIGKHRFFVIRMKERFPGIKRGFYIIFFVAEHRFALLR